MKRVLLVFSPQELDTRHELEALLAREEDLRLYFARDEKTALQALADDKPDIVVVGRSLAEEYGKTVKPYGGAQLCAAIRGRSRVPLVLVVERLNAVQRSLMGLEPRPVCYEITGDDLAQCVLEHVRTLRPPPRWLDVIVNVEGGNDWTYEMHGVGFTYTREGTLNLGPALIQNYRLTSSLLGTGADWRAGFEQFGQGMIDAFCQPNRQFRDDLKDGIDKAGGDIANSRVRFVVDPSNYNIVLEALFAPRDYVPEPWMIHAPLLRNIAGARPLHANLFDGEPSPLRVLLLCADTEGFVSNLVKPGGGRASVEKLDRVRTECENLGRYLRRLPKRMGIETVECAGIDAPLTEHALTTALSRRWDVVHFAGHSHCTSEGEASLIVREKSGAAVAVNIQTVVKYLRSTKLLYMSSCRSGSATFAEAVVHQGIPAVVGFRWGVNDKSAELHARLFYRRLFREQAIDKAFRGTRQAMHLYDQANNAWASSMLVMAN